ncbi:MAG: hypothetical protein GEV10_17255 [Streptosporangiales bacterium]|nr:hypothetical protein [Streptosporangiales bacterium]
MTTLRTAWRNESLVRGWRLPEDWWTSQVDAILSAVIAEEPLGDGCAALAAARAEAGVGLPEGYDDLWALFSVLHRIPPAPLVRRFAESYVESAPSGILCTESIDPLTGLLPVEYLRARLGEVYREATAAATEARTRHGLVSVRFAALPIGWENVTWRLAVGRILRTAFARGETIAEIGPTVVGVLTRRETAVSEGALTVDLRATVDCDVDVRRLGLPATLPGALMLLDVLAEPDTSHVSRTKPHD